MSAIVKTGGKQYSVSEGDNITVEKISGEIGDKISLEVLGLIQNDKIVLSTNANNASVEGEIVSHSRSPKIIVFKKKRRNNYRRKHGHKQNVTTLKISKISQ